MPRLEAVILSREVVKALLTRRAIFGIAPCLRSCTAVVFCNPPYSVRDACGNMLAVTVLIRASYAL
jgi:hypothetical protein